MTPQEAEEWVKTKMEGLPARREEGRHRRTLVQDAAEAELRPEASCRTQRRRREGQPPHRFAEGFPTHLDPADIAIKLAGAGGDGAQTARDAAHPRRIAEGFDSTAIPSYGPESAAARRTPTCTSPARGAVARRTEPHVLVAFNSPEPDEVRAARVPRRRRPLRHARLCTTIPAVPAGRGSCRAVHRASPPISASRW
jgi:hypothetical protein